MTHPQILQVYEDVLVNIALHLRSDELDTDLPTVNEELATLYVRDAFGIAKNEHDEIFEKVKAREPQEECGSANREHLAELSWLYKILLKHELETSQTPRYYWSGKFSFIATTILNLQSDLADLSDIKLALARWTAYGEIHRQYPLSPRVFIDLFDSATKILRRDEDTLMVQNEMMQPAKMFLPACFGLNSNIVKKLVTEEAYSPKPSWLKNKNDLTIDSFWDASRILCDSFFLFIETLHDESEPENLKVETMKSFASLIDKIRNIDQNKMEIDFEASLGKSVSHVASVGVRKTIESQKINAKDDKVRLDALIKVLKLTSRDFTALCENYESTFNM